MYNNSWTFSLSLQGFRCLARQRGLLRARGLLRSFQRCGPSGEDDGAGVEVARPVQVGSGRPPDHQPRQAGLDTSADVLQRVSTQQEYRGKREVARKYFCRVTHLLANLSWVD